MSRPDEFPLSPADQARLRMGRSPAVCLEDLEKLRKEGHAGVAAAVEKIAITAWEAYQAELAALMEVDHAHDREVIARVDLAQARQSEATAIKEARTDQLTGIDNARSLRENLEGKVRNRRTKIRNAEKSNHISIVFVDLNNFKEINTAFGHIAGDKAIKVAADFFKQNMRENDLVARKGGDELVFIMHCPLKDAKRKIQSLRKRFEKEVTEAFHLHTGPLFAGENEPQEKVDQYQALLAGKHENSNLTRKPFALSFSFGVTEMPIGTPADSEEEVVTRLLNEGDEYMRKDKDRYRAAMRIWPKKSRSTDTVELPE